MLREALKTALLDLKGQMRSRRASSYAGKGSAKDDKPKERDEAEADEGDESVVDSVMGSTEGSGSDDKASSMEAKGLDPELKAEMSKFMSKRRKGSTKGGPSKSVFAPMDAPKAKAMKGKGK